MSGWSGQSAQARARRCPRRGRSRRRRRRAGRRSSARRARPEGPRRACRRGRAPPGARLGRDRLAHRADLDEHARAGGRVELLAVDRERRAAVEHEVELLVGVSGAGGRLVVGLDELVAGLGPSHALMPNAVAPSARRTGRHVNPPTRTARLVQVGDPVVRVGRHGRPILCAGAARPRARQRPHARRAPRSARRRGRRRARAAPGAPRPRARCARRAIRRAQGRIEPSIIMIAPAAFWSAPGEMPCARSPAA